MKYFNLLIIGTTLFLASPASSESLNAGKHYSYHVDFNNIQSQTEVLGNIQKQVENKADDEELKVILFGRGRALSLDANALNNTKIKYNNTEEVIQKKVSELKNKGVRLIICKPSTNKKRHYSTNRATDTIEKEIQDLESQGYNCN